MQKLLDDPVVAECDAHVRTGFLTRVYTLLFLQLLLTMGGALVAVAVAPVRAFLLDTPSFGVAVGVAALPLLCGLHCCATRHPYNLLLLLLFTACEAAAVGGVAATYADAPQVLLLAATQTGCVFAGVLVYVRTRRVNLDHLASAVGVGTLTLASSLVLTLVLDLPPSTLLAPVGVGLFSVFLVHDTSLVMHRLGPDDVVLACVTLYLDLLNLFLCFLQCLQGDE